MLRLLSLSCLCAHQNTITWLKWLSCLKAGLKGSEICRVIFFSFLRMYPIGNIWKERSLVWIVMFTTLVGVQILAFDPYNSAAEEGLSEVSREW